jgi:hypothetical protein
MICVLLMQELVVLTLKRASKHRSSGTWSDDDYDVFDGDQHIGRIVWSYAALRAAIPKN